MTMQTFQPALDSNGQHVFCWFCHPEQYPPMPIGHTLCARCGASMQGDADDPANEAMVVCDTCLEKVAI